MIEAGAEPAFFFAATDVREVRAHGRRSIFARRAGY
jgi:hypothetical protein